MALVIILTGLSLGLLLIPISMLFRDIQFALPSLLQFAMYLTPVIYPPQTSFGGMKIFKLNPVSPLLVNARSWLLGMNDFFPVWQIVTIAGFSLVLLVIGIFIQRIVIEILIERMGS
jgi:lipopolysaccharide transport system permease protein